MAVRSEKRGIGWKAALSGSVLAIFAGAAAPAANAAPPQPGDGDAFFIPDIEAVFKPSPPESSIRAIIPLAHRVCDARANGQSDLQAANLVMTGGGADKLGVAFGSVSGQESAALGIVEAATLAYCPTYNNGNW
jgi:hypothetical protein